MLSLDGERRLALSAMSPGESVGCESPNWRCGTHEHPATVLGDDQAFGPQFLYCLADCHPRDPEMVDQLGLGGQTFTRFELAPTNGFAQHAGYLPVWRLIVRPVDVAQLQHRCTFRYMPRRLV